MNTVRHDISQLKQDTKTARRDTYRALTSLPPGLDKGIVGLLDVQLEKVRRWKVLSTLHAAVGVLLPVMGLVLGVGREHLGPLVRRQGAAHLHA